MTTLPCNCSRVSVRRVGNMLQKFEECAPQSEAATKTIGSCSHGPVGRFALLVRPAIDRRLQIKERTR
jgi:hypothetical protein